MTKENVEIVYTREARQDLLEIGAYIEQRLKSPKAARNVTGGITHSISLLRNHPEMGRSLSGILPVESPYRYLVSGNYMVFYRYEKAVFVERILYGKRDYLHVLFP